MTKIYTGNINVSLIDKEKLYEGKKGQYASVIIFVNEEPDQYGNHVAVQQQTEKDEPKIYLGNLKKLEKKSEQENVDTDTGEILDEEDDLPF
jgi:hypothetical protein